MRSAFEFFLNYCLQQPQEHSKGYSWHVLDREGIQQDILQLLFRESKTFSRMIAGHSGQNTTRQPERSAFDLLVQSTDGAKTYIEIKVDNPWSADQQVKQLSLLRQLGVTAKLILYTKSACEISRERIAEFGGGLVTKISNAELYAALDAIEIKDHLPEFNEFCAAYKGALVNQERRARKEYDGDPNC